MNQMKLIKKFNNFNMKLKIQKQKSNPRFSFMKNKIYNYNQKKKY